ncbi:aspartate 1-decarboxylase [Candidatus Absconditicoccus praedator]|uniref:aspartate 1-decarboxylase n=1 Tax=Candidatus Absconditicoccus praedator TaxID=2735562 RepID=UPI001E479824|nr:aspartate 1-decarboxylase [Candidatus Absconditicoccus praedator]UFX82891.1 aspartate 1-decarboxylase [Candidatus Absconditicoccus praedator]
MSVETQERVVSVNGGAARLAEKGDKLIIMAYEITQDEIITPTIVILGEENIIKNIKNTL